MAALRPTELRLHLSDSETKRYAQAHGWLQVYGNRARLLLEEAIPPEDLDTGALKEQLADAEQRLSESEEGSAEHNRAQKDRDRAEAFLSIAGGVRGAGTPPPELTSPSLRFGENMLRGSAAQESDCMSPNIPAEGYPLPSFAASAAGRSGPEASLVGTGWSYE